MVCFENVHPYLLHFGSNQLVNFALTHSQQFIPGLFQDKISLFNAGPIIVIHQLQTILQILQRQNDQHVGEQLILLPLLSIVDNLVDDVKVSRRIVLFDIHSASLLNVLDQFLHPTGHFLLRYVKLLQLQQFLLVVNLTPQLAHKLAFYLPVR